MTVTNTHTYPVEADSPERAAIIRAFRTMADYLEINPDAPLMRHGSEFPAADQVRTVVKFGPVHCYLIEAPKAPQVTKSRAPAAWTVTCCRCGEDWLENDSTVRYAEGEWWCADETECDDRMAAARLELVTQLGGN